MCDGDPLTAYADLELLQAKDRQIARLTAERDAALADAAKWKAVAHAHAAAHHDTRKHGA